MEQPSVDEFDDVIGGLYEAAVHPGSWQQALSALAAWSGADLFHFLRWDASGQTAPFNVYSEDVPDSVVDAYNSYYWAVDPRRRIVETLSVGELAVCQHHLSDAAVSRSELFQDYLLPVIGARYTWFSRPFTSGGQDVLLAMMRTPERGPYSDAELQRVRRVMPHLQRAARLWLDAEPLRQSAAVGLQVAEASGLALFGVDEAGRIVHVNAQAEAMLRDGEHLQQCGSCLQAAYDPDNARLREALGDVRTTRCAQRFAITSRGGQPHACFLTLSALPPASQLRSRLGAAAVLVMARRAQQRAPALAPQELARLFGLTRAESDLAVAMAGGRSLEEYVGEAGVAMSTARTHLRAVLNKTGTRRQAELVRLLLMLPASG